MARPSNRDPLDKFRWAVTIDGFGKLGFTNCETPSYTINTNKYPEGGAHLYPKQIVDSIDYKPVTFQRGVATDMDFEVWAKQIFDLHDGVKKETFTPRRTVIIDHLNRSGNIVKRYVLYNAFPIEYKPASDFQSDADDAISMEKLVLGYESFEVLPNPNNESSNPFDPTDLLKRIINRKF